MNQPTIPKQYLCLNCDENFKPELSLCPKCVKDPTRKPRVVILYGAPPIVAAMGARPDPRPEAPRQNQRPALTGDAQMPLAAVTPAIWAAVQRALAGYVFFKCQRPACAQLVARKPRADGTLPQENQYCGKPCLGQDTGEARRTKVWVACACGCGLKREVHQSELKHSKAIYFSKRHFYEHRKRLAEERRDPTKYFLRKQGEAEKARQAELQVERDKRIESDRAWRRKFGTAAPGERHG